MAHGEIYVKHMANEIIKCSMASSASIVTPETGSSGAYRGVTFLAGGGITGARSIRYSTFVSFPTAGMDPNRGRLEFMYRPIYPSSGSAARPVRYLASISEPTGEPSFTLSFSDRLSFCITDASNVRHQATTIKSPNIWKLNAWTRVACEWDATSNDSLRLFVNGARVDQGTVPGGWSCSPFGNKLLYLGNTNAVDGMSAEGILAGLTASNLQAVVPPPPPPIDPPVTGTTPPPVGQTLAQAKVISGSGMTSFGVPLALGAAALADPLAVYQNGVKVPSAATQIASWPDGSTKWALISTNVTAGANIEVRKEQPAPITTAITITPSATGFIVNTGFRTFTIDNTSLFGTIKKTSGETVGTGTPITLSVGGTTMTLGTQREAKIARNDGLTATITMENDIAGGTQQGLGLRRVYKFKAGSGSVDVRFVVMNYDSKYSDGTISSGGVPNAVRVDKATAAISVPSITMHHVQANGFSTSANVPASIEQRQRSANTSPASYVLTQGTTVRNGSYCMSPMVQVVGTSCLRLYSHNMPYMEPQRMWTTAQDVGFDFISDHVWVGAKQGMWAEFTVDACDTASAEMPRTVVMPTNIVTSNALEASPMQSVAPAFKAAMVSLMGKSFSGREAKGLYGFMTYGGQPRYWNDPMMSDEIAQSSPTGNTWDRVYWGTTWTDYHQSAESVTLHALSAQCAESFYRWSEPAALRMLYTQCYQARPGNTNFYSWAAPAGYYGFRSDMNSSHQYWGNLYLYYYLTGDTEVTRALKQSASNFRNYFCSSRPGSACAINVAPIDQWAAVNGRVFAQWERTFRFIGETVDKTFWEDWMANEARSLYRHSLTAPGPDGNTMSLWLGGPGSSDQLWMNAGYDMRNKMLYAADLRASGNITEATKVENFIVGWVKTMLKYASIDGKPTSQWSNALSYSSPNGATTTSSTSVTSVTRNTSGGDPYLYSSGKAMMLRLFWYAAQKDASLMSAFTEWQTFALNSLKNEAAPLSKPIGIYLAGMSGIYL